MEEFIRINIDNYAYWVGYKNEEIPIMYKTNFWYRLNEYLDIVDSKVVDGVKYIDDWAEFTITSPKRKLYRFLQNNSFGEFKGLHCVFIEAESAEEANELFLKKGIGYFDGVEKGVDCPCCGDRWERATKVDTTMNLLTFISTGATFYLKDRIIEENHENLRKVGKDIYDFKKSIINECGGDRESILNFCYNSIPLLKHTLKDRANLQAFEELIEEYNG